MFNWIGFAFVSDDIPDYEVLEDEIQEKIDILRDEAQEKLIRFLEDKGLEMEMGVVIPAGSLGV